MQGPRDQLDRIRNNFRTQVEIRNVLTRSSPKTAGRLWSGTAVTYLTLYTQACFQ